MLSTHSTENSILYLQGSALNLQSFSEFQLTNCFMKGKEDEK